MCSRRALRTRPHGPPHPTPSQLRFAAPAAYDREAAEMRGEPYVLSIEVQDVPGVLNQVGRAGAWSAGQASLAVGRALQVTCLRERGRG